MALRTRHVLAVQDLQLTKRYYIDVLGFEVDMEPDGWVFLKRDGCVLMLDECPDNPLPAHSATIPTLPILVRGAALC